MDSANEQHQELELHDAVVNIGESHLPMEVRRNMVLAPSMSNPARMLNVPVEVITVQQDSPAPRAGPVLPMVVANKSATPADKDSFLRELETFYRERNTELKISKFYGQPVDLYKLWNEVITWGGYDKVSELKKWRQVGDTFNPPQSCTAVSAIFRGFYEKALLAFERYKFQKGDLQIPSIPAQPSTSRVETGDCQASGSGPSGYARRDAANGAMHIVQAGSSQLSDRGTQIGRVMSPRSVLITDNWFAADWVKITVEENGDGYDIYALVPGMHNDEVKVESDSHGRVIITGTPGDIDNVWGIKPFQKVISLPAKLEPKLTEATFRQLGRLSVRVHNPLGSAGTFNVQS